ncbi:MULTISPECIES: tyrosine-type recombinase/integrase [Pseudomonas]|uniref:tyrosine-type recombinase/integrase n=1 Tax=Pseudomonas TaxID=286 RepID=UPI000B4959C7|nr:MULTISPECIES: tyrosine-type recombinase/integrase [Pseudomonas]MCU9100523.1 tyrosine-type recombinase/integrase [Pseudomonas aeruginosa]MCU9249853.1 tyrosine-type recombinase/integrase [Pseudomonas aeruginosa]MCU9301159.1 tyrosine-type recombinase/integrase [Pseudomonas aeruginosa]MCU9506675.1 tyrosine-type recombinase/integrase [Pseudomonas aeruginosa]MDG1580587.1 tyrosine-type recombinase/integrase [Pseudomonas sp. GOM6]
MNALTPSLISVPVTHGLTLSLAAGHDPKILEVAMPHLAKISESIYRHHNSPLLSEFMDNVLNRFLRQNPRNAKSAYQLRARMAKIKAVLTQDDPLRRVASLSNRDIQTLKDDLPKLLRKNNTSSSQGDNLQAYYRLFNRMLDQAANDHWVDEDLKIKGCQTTKSKITKSFLDSNLVSLFNSWPYQAYAADTPRDQVRRDAHSYCFWLMPLGLFTGARLNELCQLRVHDVFHDAHGVPLISINDNGFKKSLKNEQSRREIPICSKLIAMGFLDFVEERRQAEGPDALLFSELHFDEKHLYSRAASRFFCGPVTGAGFIGQHCPVALSGGFNFKSFRRTFAVQLQKSGVPATVIAHLLGHDSDMLEVTREHYLDKPQSVFLLDTLERSLSYNLPLGAINWQHFKNLMSSQAGRSKRGRKAKKTLH